MHPSDPLAQTDVAGDENSPPVDWSVGGGLWLQYRHNDPLTERRIALLEAIAATGSITQAAQQVGLSYKAAWDSVDAMNNLAEQPLVERSAGGRKGGGTRLTDYGVGVLEHYRQIRVVYERFLQQLGDRLALPGDATTLLGGLRMRTSARNQFRGKVTAVNRGAVNGDVILALGDGLAVQANITNEAIDELGLRPGKPAFAIIKASFVLLSPDENVRVSARNRLTGTIVCIMPGAVNTEVKLELAGGRILTAIVTAESQQELGLDVGQRCTALVKSSHVLVGVAD